MQKDDYFKFENETQDFPLYNDNPHISAGKWAVMILSAALTIFLIMVPLDFLSELGIYKRILYFIIPVLGFGFAVDWKFGLICKKFKKGDFKLIVILLIAEFVFSSVLNFALTYFGVVAQDNPVISQLTSISTWLVFPFQIFGEELIKIIPFIVFLMLFYKFTKNRKMSIVIATTLSLLIFALLHLPAYESLISVLFLQGLGSIFTMYAYLKTKNILVSYAIHLLLDTIIFLIVLVPVMLGII
ncbi:hypothetical protein MmiEs2_09830 [Methanimicrococcus stummii]|uniref:CAAX prenyl protease 2/Lysostaphin resistance protein A-like domain-containing protein n=1 Tax=Methanimicrococcus stummii TaxID=3028294 RepID=A0AA96V8L5_9EURY|nr:lysostaphin resistance A-like protein [Methanimicrococcus sp. Es2]WNY28779.1 hypothetical protein MmiEs2_09830 [Methanimicrococcus sp. Es2]